MASTKFFNTSVTRCFQAIDRKHRAEEITATLIEARDRTKEALGEKFAQRITPYVDLIKHARKCFREDTIQAMYRCLRDLKEFSKDTRADQVMIVAAAVEMLDAERLADSSKGAPDDE